MVPTVQKNRQKPTFRGVEQFKRSFAHYSWVSKWFDQENGWLRLVAAVWRTTPADQSIGAASNRILVLKSTNCELEMKTATLVASA